MSNTSIIIFFVITAVFGLILMSYVLQNKKRPIYIVALHGIFAVASYGMFVFNIGEKTRQAQLVDVHYPLENYSYVCFSVAAVLGLLMLIRDKILSKGIPKWIPFVHGGFAAAGLVILIIATVMKN